MSVLPAGYATPLRVIARPVVPGPQPGFWNHHPVPWCRQCDAPPQGRGRRPTPVRVAPECRALGAFLARPVTCGSVQGGAPGGNRPPRTHGLSQFERIARQAARAPKTEARVDARVKSQRQEFSRRRSLPGSGASWTSRHPRPGRRRLLAIWMDGPAPGGALTPRGGGLTQCVGRACSRPRSTREF
jgi:hypothetical protein